MLYSTAKYNYFFTNIQVFFTEISRSTDFLSRNPRRSPDGFREFSHESTKTRRFRIKKYLCVFVPLWLKISGVPGETVAFFKSFRYTG